MYTYNPWTGQWLGPRLSAHGYSGAGAGKDNPDMESIVGVGPVPRGRYRITLEPPGAHANLADPVMRLNPLGPVPGNRSGFLIHGDNALHTASHGCIILDHATRVAIASGLDAESYLLVAGDKPTTT